jgi:transcriptional regulator with XRE-family HTH domain
VPRPNQPRSIAGEHTLARRIAMEREGRGWTYEALATRMTEAGCPIQSSAIYKIEKGDPPRRITVDELLAFSSAFALPVVDLLRPREVAINARLGHLFDKWEDARQEAVRAQARTDEAFAKLAEFVQRNHGDALASFYELITDWSADQGGSEAEREAVRAIVLASAVPVAPFQDLERDALDALKAEREREAD